MKYVLEKNSEYIEEIKKSRFVAYAVYVEDDVHAFRYIEELKDPTANHNCWAFIAGSFKRFSDDGEPSGTAGKPILSSIEYSDVTNILIIVTRYFGGIKLGAGGIIRAYSGVTSRCIENSSVIPLVHYVELKVVVKFNQIGKIYSIIKSSEVQKLNELHTTQGVEISVKLPISEELEFQEKVRNELANSASVFKI